MSQRIVTFAAAAMLVAGCTTDPFTGEQKLSNAAGGALIGAGVGTVAGLAIGGGGNRNAALLGAGLGALAGAGIGAYMDQQESELRAQLAGTGVSVTRNGENIILNMPSNIAFATDQDTVTTSFYPTLNAVALVANKYNRTLVDVYGHTDSTGDEGYNIDLSQRSFLHPGLRRIAADRHQRHTRRTGAEPPRRNPDDTAQVSLTTRSSDTKTAAAGGRFSLRAGATPPKSTSSPAPERRRSRPRPSPW